ncbi:dihydroorotate dehydrogenase (quinone) [Haemophilus paracuniculus]|uniref:Dihydroorotate dehydrogenase (quinone) n=1 Tax=Haemophilus paracuniculus TaxID=734 RepID=A0A1T0ARQ7_9PAST|nr:dihydroorotate dehydrogenase (quinone) [Haemophilus paracuniculus]OOR98783.1 dihydroorotate dehydrogenase (quinone) [Haemophilus paracuniculus]
MYSLIRQGLLGTGKSRELSLKALKIYGNLPFKGKIPENPVSVMGIQFKNPIGLAAGLDINGEAIDGLGRLGFGFIEVGTVTPKAETNYPHLETTRLHRAKGIIHRHGGNNLGIDAVIENVSSAEYKGVVGINIGKNADTSLDASWDDYQICLQKAYQFAHYITVNLDEQADSEWTEHLLKSLKHEQFLLSQKYRSYKPLVIKLSPDLTADEIAQIADSLVRHNIDGVIAGNGTLSREMVGGVKNAEQAGRLSGKPLHSLNNQFIRQLAHALNGKIPIVGCGGVHSVPSAQEKINAGASLIQLYSGFILQGSSLIQQLATGVEVK